MTVDPQRVEHEYFFAACDYYIDGRFAFWTNQRIVCGNLLHHAIEFFLKGCLYPRLSLVELKEIGHDLPRLWRRFEKEASSDSRLSSFDRTIGELQAFEAIRYPEQLFRRGGAVTFEIFLTRADVNTAARLTKVKRRSAAYRLAMAEVDQLVRLLFELCDLSPEAFLLGRPPNRERRRYLLKGNVAWGRLRKSGGGDA